MANPNKPQPIVDILANNRDKLLKYLEDFHTEKGEGGEGGRRAWVVHSDHGTRGCDCDMQGTCEEALGVGQWLDRRARTKSRLDAKGLQRVPASHGTVQSGAQLGAFDEALMGVRNALPCSVKYWVQRFGVLQQPTARAVRLGRAAPVS